MFSGIVAERSLSAPVWTWSGIYEWEIQRYLRRFAPPGACVYDIGGADGLFALAFAKLTGEICVSFEGSPEEIAKMQRHMEHNHPLSDRVEIVEGWVGGAGIRLDDFVRSHERPTFLKIDVEAAEYDVLRSALGLLAESRPHILIEVHGRDQEVLCGDLLVGLGYRPSIVPLRRRLRETTRDGSHFDVNHWLVAEGSAPVRNRVHPRKRRRLR